MIGTFALVVVAGVMVWFAFLRGFTPIGLRAQTCPTTNITLTSPASQLIGTTAVIAWSSDTCATDFKVFVDRLYEDVVLPCTGIDQNNLCYTGTAQSYTASNLLPGSSYDIWVAALNPATGLWEETQKKNVIVQYPSTTTSCTQTCMQVSGRTASQCDIACSTVCTPPAAPKLLAPQGASVPVLGQPYHITWTEPSWANSYTLQINDEGVGGAEARFQTDCTSAQFPGDVCLNNLTTPWYDYTFQAGHVYSISVTPSATCGIGTAVTSTVTATLGTSTCIIQGYKQAASGAQASVSNLQVRVADGGGTINYQLRDNPFSVVVPGGQDYTLTADVPSGYTIASTACVNSSACHTVADSSYTTGNTRVLRCVPGGYTDIRWYYDTNAAICTAPSAPQIVSVASTPQAVGGGVDTQVTWQTTDTPTVPHTYRVELSVDGQVSWLTIATGTSAVNYTTTHIANVNPCFRVSAIAACGTASPQSVIMCADPNQPPGTQPTPTPIPTTGSLQCYGTQHCSNGNTTYFEYCGTCSGAGCSAGFTCRDPGFVCTTYPGKKFFSDVPYPIDCALLSPTPTPTSPANAQVTCANCDARSPYLCTTTSGGAGASGATSFCWDQAAPSGGFLCTLCSQFKGIRPGIIGSQQTPTPPGAPSNPVFAANGVFRERTGQRTERITIRWEPIVSGYPRIEISTDGGITWDVYLTGNGPYPGNEYTTTVSNVTDKPILIRMTIVNAAGQSSQTISQALPPLGQLPTNIAATTAPSTSSSPVSPALLAAAGILIALVIAAFVVKV